jgi:hypothetical protein
MYDLNDALIYRCRCAVQKHYVTETFSEYHSDERKPHGLKPRDNFHRKKKRASNNKIQHMSAHVYKTLNCPKREDDTAKCQGCVPWSSTVMAQTLYVF